MESQGRWKLGLGANGLVAEILGSAASAAVSLNQPFAVSLRVNSLGGGILQLNGSVPSGFNFSPVLASSGPLLLGARNGVGYSSLDLAEVRYYRRQLADLEHAQLMESLMKKWGVSP
jgi:hypothetical protein